MGDDTGAALHITVVRCLAPRRLQAWTLTLAPGATVAEALRACTGLGAPASALGPETGVDCGIWGRRVAVDARLQNGDRLEIYRPLEVDPKVARRERFARQGTRSAGLFARPKPRPNAAGALAPGGVA
ncbi:MAG: RnfH family protein [Burkholderiaceae bacterium]|nr:RnfH family protein [Burkholderiaceae bacterium]